VTKASNSGQGQVLVYLLQNKRFLGGSGQIILNVQVLKMTELKFLHLVRGGQSVEK